MALVSGGGANPTGIAGGDLGGTYPNPTVTAVEAGVITNTMVNASAAIAQSKLATIALRTAFVSRSVSVGGNMTFNSSAAYAEMAAATGGPGTGGFDLAISAATGDVLDVSLTVVAGTATAVDIWADIATFVSAAAVNWLGQSSASNANDGLGYIAPSARIGSTTLRVLYTVQAGDITGGNVVLRPFYLSGSNTNRLIGRSVSGGPFNFAVVNLAH